MHTKRAFKAYHACKKDKSLSEYYKLLVEYEYVKLLYFKVS